LGRIIRTIKGNSFEIYRKEMERCKDTGSLKPEYIHKKQVLKGVSKMKETKTTAQILFDVSVKDIYTSVMTGASLVLIPKEMFCTPPVLLDYLCEKKVTTPIWAISALTLVSALKGLRYRVPGDVKRVMFSGEIMPAKQLRRWQKALPQAEFINLYGPTEITCNCTYYPVKRIYEDQFYNYAMLAELVLSFILFLLLVLFGIRSKMAYILKLSDEVEILEGGSLDYKITIKGQEYVEKIDRKARRMKQLTDHLFEYSLTAGEEEVQLEEPETCETLFYDLFSETCSYLEQQGFEVSFQVEWPQSRLRISTDYVMRIMDNLTSNIMKYADPSMPVAVSAVEEGSMVGFLFENKVKKPEEETESNGIGIQSVKNMMAKMRGKCMTEQEEERFRVLLLFPGQTGGTKR